MTLDMTQANYNLAIATLKILLDKPSKSGSPEDLQISMLGRFVEDYEISRLPQDPNITSSFEPYYIET